MWSRQLMMCRTGSTMMLLTTDLATCSSTLSSIAGRRRGKNGDRQLQSFSCCWSPPSTTQIHLSPRPSTNFPLQATLQLNRMWKWQVARKYHACRSVTWSRVLLVSSTTTTPFHPTSLFLWLGMRRATTSMVGENQRKEMGEGEEHKTRDDPKIEIQERGEIFFFYRPKVGREEVHSADDVQRLYIVLRPESGDRAVEKKQESKSGKEGRKAQDDKDDEDRKGAAEGGHGEEEVNIERETLLRFMVLGRKSLPDPSKRSTPYWGFVELVTTKVDDIKEALKGGTSKDSQMSKCWLSCVDNFKWTAIF